MNNCWYKPGNIIYIKSYGGFGTVENYSCDFFLIIDYAKECELLRDYDPFNSNFVSIKVYDFKLLKTCIIEINKSENKSNYNFLC